MDLLTPENIGDKRELVGALEVIRGGVKKWYIQPPEGRPMIEITEEQYRQLHEQDTRWEWEKLNAN